MEIRFKRRLTNEILTTFLPSFFLVGICYATTFFKRFYFEAAVTVNLTVMLVTTTLFVRLYNFRTELRLSDCNGGVDQCYGEAAPHLLHQDDRHLADRWPAAPLPAGRPPHHQGGRGERHCPHQSSRVRKVSASALLLIQ